MKINPNSLKNLSLPKDYSFTQSEEYKQKMSIIMKNRPTPPNSLLALREYHFKKGVSSLWKGKKRGPMSEETKRKISEAKKGKPSCNKGKLISEKQKIKLRKAWSYEKHITPHFLETMSKSISKKWTDPEYRAKRMRYLLNTPPNKGRVFSEEHNQKISNSKKGIPNIKLKGIPRSEETKQKIREKRMYQKFSFKDTKIERMMQIALSLHGIPFEKHKALPGQPDIFIEPNICVFVDGEYWHADPRIYKPDHVMMKDKKAREIWQKDIRFSQKLNSLGYHVIRIWEKEIENDVNNCAENIIKLIQQVRGKIVQ